MKTHSKIMLLASLAALGTGGGILLAQSTGSLPSINPPSLQQPPPLTPPSTVTSPGTGARRGTGARASRQPRMELALISLREARTHLENSLPDKGGNRERAIASVDQAIKDVQAGIAYADAHPDEFPARGAVARGTGARGTRGRGARGTGTAAAPPPAGG